MWKFSHHFNVLLLFIKAKIKLPEDSMLLSKKKKKINYFDTN